MALTIVISACGKKDKVENMVEQAAAETLKDDKSVEDEVKEDVEDVEEVDVVEETNLSESALPEQETENEYIEGIEDNHLANTKDDTDVKYLYIDSVECFKWDGPLHLYIKDTDGTIYHLGDMTVLTDGIPCNDDECDPLLWAARYIDHSPITDESDPDGPYYCLGFGGTDVWKIRTDEENNITAVIDILAAD